MSFLIKKEYLLFLLLSSFVAVIVGARGDTRDTYAYYEVFKNIDSYSLLEPAAFYQKSGMEIGFGWYSYIVSFFTSSTFFLFLIISFLTFIFIYKTAKNIGVSFTPMIILYLSSGYFFLQQFMQIRQGLAIPIALYAITLFIKSNRVTLPFIVFSLLAVSFHQSAALLLLVAVLVYFFLKNNNLNLFIFKILSLLLFIFFLFLSKYFLVNFLIGFSGRIESYSESEYAEAVGLFRLPNVKALLTLFFIFFMFDDKLYKDKIITTFYILFTIGVALRIGFSDFGILSGRLAISFTFVEIFILPFIFMRFGKLGILGLLLFVTFQAIATYFFQAPYILTDYFKPLY